MSRRKRIVLLGATGSIGSSTLKVIRSHPGRLQLVGVAAARSSTALANICQEFEVEHAVLTDDSAYAEARHTEAFPEHTRLAGGASALETLALEAKADIVLVATTGTTSLRPALAAIEAGIDIALANKELLVLGGEHVISAAQRKGVRLLPTDSEHNALFQCLGDAPGKEVKKMILTASGGQFRDSAPSKLERVTPEEATCHPNWSMGPKITVDSATMANKGLELIEAHWLFGMEANQLEVVIHPQSIVHSMVEFIDGSILAQLSPPSMTFAIQHCLLYPERQRGTEESLDFRKQMDLSFHPPDPARYPCLGLAQAALAEGGDRPAVFNAANEVAVAAFLEKSIGFLDIPKCIAFTLEHCDDLKTPSLEALFEIDKGARKIAQTYRPRTNFRL